MEERVVYSSINNMEVDYICSVLKENGIAFIKKTEGAGDYLTIMTGNLFNCPTTIWVSEKDFKKAYELISTINDEKEDSNIVEIPDELENISGKEEKDMEKKARKAKMHLKLFVLLFVFCPILIAIIAVVINDILPK